MRLVALITLFLVCSTALAQEDSPTYALQLQDAFVEIGERVAPSVVGVTAYISEESDEEPEDIGPRAAWVKSVTNALPPGHRLCGSGSGFIIEESGLILTCRHVVLTPDGELADVISVDTHSGNSLLARIVGVEPTLNLALLQLEVPLRGEWPPLKPIRWGQSKNIKVGHWAIALADPVGADRFFTAGLFAGVPNRDCYQEQLAATHLQAVMQVHPDAYGGPIVNLDGEVVGLLTRLGVGESLDVPDGTNGIVHAVPSAILQTIYPGIVRQSSTQSPWLGFAVMSRVELRREVGHERFLEIQRTQPGIYIENVFDPSPAAEAGVQPGDFLVRFNGAFIRTPFDFQKAVYFAGIGETVELEFHRNREPYRCNLRVNARPKEAVTR